MPDSVLRDALKGFIRNLTQEAQRCGGHLDIATAALEAESPTWTIEQSTGYMAAQKARADTLYLTVYRLERLLREAGDK